MSIPVIFKGVIDRLEDRWAVIKTEDNKEILWPAKSLPEKAAPGSMVRLTLSDLENEKEGQEALAKTMLNEILNKPAHEKN
ncbi:DUF3006 domain-containing protein [Patescibacteria group bacterium]|nr:DUF3006 domain-containing protein [Patescibacteria group bacterium]